MIQIKTSILEKRLGKKLLDNFSCVGIDTASRSGWCKITNRSGIVTIDFGFVEIKSKDVYYKYDEMIKVFKSLLENWNCSIIIEDVFFGRNANVLKMLARIGMIVYVLSNLGGHKTKFILASVARASIGVKGVAKKEVVHQQIVKMLQIDLKDIDVVDAFVLALNGMVIPEGLDIK